MPTIHYSPLQTPKYPDGVLSTTRLSLCGRDIHPEHFTARREFDSVTCKQCLQRMMRLSEMAMIQATDDAKDCITRPASWLSRRASECTDGVLSLTTDLLGRVTDDGKEFLVEMWSSTYQHEFKHRYKPTQHDEARGRLSILVNDGAKVGPLRDAVIDYVRLLDTDGVVKLAALLTERKF